MRSQRMRLAMAALAAGVCTGAMLAAPSLPGAAAVDPGSLATGAVAPVDPGPVEALSTAESDTVRNADGSYTATIYSGPVNYEAADGTWQRIDNTLVDAPTAGYAAQNAAGPYSAKIPDDPATTPVKFQANGAWVTMRMHGASDSAPSVAGTTATLDDVSRTDGVTYEATGSGLKESIELDAAPAAGSGLSYVYSIDTSAGLTPSIDEATDQILFRTSGGNTPIHIPAPVMSDSAVPSAESGAIAYSLSPDGGEWTLRLTPDIAWLTDPARVYPVLIDPTLSHQPPSRDCFIMSTAANGGQSSSHCGAAYVRVGGSDASNRYRGLLDFNVASIPSTAVVSAATANLYLDSTQSLNSQTSAYSLLRLTRPFDGNASWISSGNAGNWSTPGGDFVAASSGTPALSLSGVNSGFKAFDVAGIVQDWVRGTTEDGTPAHEDGVVLKQVDTTRVDNELYFVSSADGNPVAQKPYLNVNYIVAPAQPSDISISPGEAGDGAYAASLTPTVSASLIDPSGADVRLHLVVKDAAGDTVADVTSAYLPDVPTGTTTSVTVPSGDLQDDTDYTFILTAEDVASASVPVTQPTYVFYDDPVSSSDLAIPAPPDDAASLESAIFASALSCEQGEGAVSTTTTTAQMFGTRAADGSYTAPTVEGATVDGPCASAALGSAMSAVNSATDDTTLLTALDSTVASAESTTVQPDLSWVQLSPESAGSRPPDSGGGCEQPSQAAFFVFGESKPYVRGMAEMVHMRLHKFIRLRNGGRPCFYNWDSDGCSLPFDLPGQPYFLNSCYRHDWGYRNLKRADAWYGSQAWNENNKAVTDTQLYLDMHNACDANFAAGSFAHRKCWNQAWVYYTAVSRFKDFDTFKDWESYYILP